MKRLAHFTLEGLIQQGPHQVWVCLGTFATAELAETATGGASCHRSGVIETRIMPLYRDCEPTVLASRGKSKAPAAVESVTLA